MEQRVNIEKQLPNVWKAMYGLAGSVAKTSLSPTEKNLIKLRASQINGCAYCIDMHTKEAIKEGEQLKRIFLVSAWRETDLFTQEEQVILRITEEVTLIHQNGLSQETYSLAGQFFNVEQIAEIIMNVALINTWNRIAVSTHLPLMQ